LGEHSEADGIYVSVKRLKTLHKIFTFCKL